MNNWNVGLKLNSILTLVALNAGFWNIVVLACSADFARSASGSCTNEGLDRDERELLLDMLPLSGMEKAESELETM